MTLARRDQDTGIVLSKDDQLQALEAAFAVGIRQRELLEQYIKDRLKPAIHFYHVAGSEKPSLSKDGAELICLPHGYHAEYDWIGGPKEPLVDDMPYQITLNCRLLKAGGFAGGGMGSASSHITKRDGSRVPRQTDPGLRHNATIKMAQKSSYIAATLSATAASEFFVQDIEDSPEDTPDTSQHYCETHQVNWFKRGRMRGFAHRIGDTDQWCNEPTAGPVPGAAATPQVTRPSVAICPIHTGVRMGRDSSPEKRWCHKLQDGTFCYGVAPEPTEGASDPPESEGAPPALADEGSALLKAIKDAGLTPVEFDDLVLKMPWTEWEQLCADRAVAIALTRLAKYQEAKEAQA